MKEIKGGLSAVFAKLLQLFFGAHDVSTAGFSAELASGRRICIWLDMGPVIADESAQHVLYGAKGAAGLKPCLLCCNVFNRRFRADTIADADTGGWSVQHTEHDASKFVLQTEDTLGVIINRLAVPMSKANREAMQTNFGWNHVPDGIMHCGDMLQHVHPVTHVCFDWMYVFFVSGIFNATLMCVASALQPFGVTWQALDTYCSAWNLPHRLKYSFKISEVFTRGRVAKSKEAGTYKTTASEGLVLLEVLSCFMHAIVAGSRSEEVKKHARCFLLLAYTVELLQRAARVRVTGREYLAAASRFLKAFRETYGVDWMTPKCHSCLHFATFLDRWGILPNCFVLERKHRFPKRWANAQVNTSSSYEGAVLRSCTAHHLEVLAHGDTFATAAALVEGSPAKGKVAKTLVETFGNNIGVCNVSQKARISEFEVVHVGDLCLLSSAEGEPHRFVLIQYLLQQVDVPGSVPLALVRVYTAAEEQPRSWKLAAAAGDEATLVPCCDITTALIWTEGGAGRLQAVKPFWLQDAPF